MTRSEILDTAKGYVTQDRIVPSAVYRHRIADITGIEDLRFEEKWVSK